MTELIFNGKFELSTDKKEEFLQKVEQIMKETATEFSGRILSYNIQDYTDYVEVTDQADGGSEDQGDTDTSL